MLTIYDRINFNLPNSKGPILVAKRSNACTCGRWLCGIAVSNPGGGMHVLKCFMLSRRGHYNELTARSGESYRLWRVVVCNLETS